MFMEEALGELDKINEYLPKWKANPGDEDSLVVVRRAFHTLKGGGRLIGAELVGEFSWSMENMLNRVIDHSIDATPVLFDTLDEAAAALPQLIEQIRGNRAPIEGIDDLIQRAHALSRGEEPPPGGGTGSPMPGKAPDGASGAVDDTASEEASSGGVGAEEAGGPPGGGDVKPDAMSSGGVADGDIAAATGELAIGTGDEPDAGAESPSGDAAPPEPASETAERVDGATASGGAEAPTPWSELEGLGELDAPARSSGAGADARGDGDADEAPEGSKQTVDPSAIDDDLIASFVEEADELIDSCDQAVAQWRDHPDDTAAPAQIQRHLHTLKGGARMADLAPAGQLTHELESLVEAASAHPAARDGPLFDVLHEGVDTLTAMLGEVRAQRPISSPDELRGRINALRADALGTGDEGAHLGPDGADAEASQGPSTAAELDDAEPAVDVECADDAQSGRGSDLDSGDVTRELDPSDPHPAAASVGPAAAEPSPPAEGQPVVEKASPADPIDPESDDELMHSFLEESGELVERCDEAVSRWRNAPHEPEPGATLQRAFHTIKGGARMANVAPLGDLIHELESLLQGVDSGECDRNEALFDALQEAVDAISAMLSEVGAGRAPAKPDELIARLASLRRGHVPGTEASATEGGHGAPGAASTPAEHAHEPATASAMAPEASDSLVAVFAQEAETHQTVLRDAFLDSEGAPVEAGQAIDTGVVRALHTLVGSAETAGCEAIAGLASPMEEIVKRRRDARSDLTAGDVAALGEAVRQLDTMLRHLRDHGEEPALPEPARERLIAQRDKAQADLDSSQDEGGDELVDVFLEEADELAEACDQGLARWREQPDDPDITSELQRSLHTLKGGARMAHLPPIADLTHEVESLIRAVDDGSRGVSEELFDLLQEAVDALTVLLEQVRGRQPIARVDWLIEDLQNLRERASGDAAAAPATRATDQPASEPAGAAPVSTAEDSDDGTREQASAPAQASADASAAGSSDRADTSDGAEKDGDTAAQGGSSQSTRGWASRWASTGST
ncbi:MAG: hypothetical protein BRD57_03180 [Proteobacteria bacterium SW_6_67_9]|nr:MAG: hypothetical protein BRD57_03180 [Proteobacteria bacterium SW_6_67_9]